MKMQVRVVLSLAVVLAIMGMAGCGHYVCSTTFGAGSCTPSGGGLGQGNGGGGTAFFYFLDDSKVAMGLETLSFNSSSSTSAPQYESISNFVIPPLPTSGVDDGGAIVVLKKYLYIPFANNTLYGYSIDATSGALTSVPNSPYTVAGANSIASDPTGSYLFVGDSGSGDINVLAVNPNDGSLTTVGTSVASGVFPTQLVTDGQGKFLYAAEGFAGGQVAAFSISQGILTAVSGSPFSLNLAQVSGEASGKFLLGIDENDNQVSVFAIGSSGVPNQVTGSPFQTSNVPTSIVVHPNGTWVYTFSQDSLQDALPVEQYSLSSTGQLQSVQAFSSILSFNGKFEQSGQFMFSISQELIGGKTQIVAQPLTVDSSGGLSTGGINPEGFPSLGSFAVTDSASN